MVDYQCVSVQIEWIEGEASRQGRAVQNYLEGIEATGRAAQVDYTPEDDQDPDIKGALTLWVAALTEEEYAKLITIPAFTGEPDDVKIQKVHFRQGAGEGAAWNPAIYYCGRACGLPAFAE